MNIFGSLEAIFGSPFLLVLMTFSFILKGYILTRLIVRGLQTATTKRPFAFLVVVLIGSMIADSAWIFHLVRSMWFPTMDYRPYLFWVRLSWGFSLVQHQALS